VTVGRGSAEELAVADDEVIGRTLSVELGEQLGLEIGPRNGFDRDGHAGLGLVFVDEFLQVVGRIPLGPQDGQLLSQHRGAGGEQQAHARQYARSCLAHVIPPFALNMTGNRRPGPLTAPEGNFLILHGDLLRRASSAH
jgi:hypothetical protein